MRIDGARAFFNGILLAAALFLPSLSSAQPATPAQRAGVQPNKEFGTLHLQSNLGSFRMIDGEGRVEVTYAGTIMISGDPAKFKVQTTGNLKQSYKDARRQTWFGRGTIVVTGSFRAIQWFGKDMRAVWFGRGIVRLNAEYDRDLKTGSYWYDNPAVKNEWFPQGTVTVTVPMTRPGQAPGGVVPRERQSGG